MTVYINSRCSCRLGLDCPSDGSETQKRACRACHSAKVACGALFDDACNRCQRLGLECVPREMAAPGSRAHICAIVWRGRQQSRVREAVAISIAIALPIMARRDAVRIALRPAAPLEVAPSLWEQAGGLAVGAYAWQRRTCSSALRSIAPCA